MAQKLFAIWRLSHFPYFTGSEISKFVKDGFVETEGCGSGFRFKPIKICLLKEGSSLKQSLKDLDNEYRIKSKKLHDEYLEKIEELIGEKAE